MYEFDLVLLLLQQMCVFLVIAWLMSKTRLFIPLMQVTVRLPHKLLCYVTFSIFCIMGTYFGLHIEDSIANTRAIGAVMGGLLGGPVVGGLVGLTGGLHRYSLGGMTALSCMVSTIVEGLLGGLVHSVLVKRGRPDKVFSPLTAGAITFVAELVQMMIILLIARPFQDALHLVQSIAAPMMVTNTVGAALFMRILLDKRAMFEKYTSAFSATALKVAASTEGILRQGFNEENSMKVAQVLIQELDIGAVAITDRDKLLAFTGIGDDHHLPGKPISSSYTQRAIETGEVVYADGNEVPYRCSIHPHCKLGSTLVIPLRGENQRVIGTIKLYEAKNRLFSSINRTLGEGIAQLLSAQILADVENAMLKHPNIANPHLGVGEITIRASQDDRWLQLDIEDNAGLYRANPQASGLGMNLVDRRLRARFGADCGISVTCEPERFTRVTLRLPLEENAC
ncbi:LytS/YhcK type 5TM receptor domain-containing protein [Klebsiella pneumoniae]